MYLDIKINRFPWIKIVKEILVRINSFYFCVLRMERISPAGPAIHAVYSTSVNNLCKVGNLGLLFFLLFFIFAALGVEMFGRLGEYWIPNFSDKIFFFSGEIRRHIGQFYCFSSISSYESSLFFFLYTCV
jgi:hypothetical protein